MKKFQRFKNFKNKIELQKLKLTRQRKKIIAVNLDEQSALSLSQAAMRQQK